MMTSKPLGLYVHTPFCLRKCAYCDFCSYTDVDAQTRAAYIDTLCQQISSFGVRARESVVDTVYFGGGTPSLLSPKELSRIMCAIRDTYRVAEDAEITLEANPRTLSPEKVRAYRSLGINRMSIGLQSIHENEQKTLGRIHNYEDFLDAYRMAREGGIDNISVDLMYAIPEQTLASLAASVSAVLALRPEHISVYSLIVEEGTPFYERRHTLHLPDEERESEMYRLLCDKLRRGGYRHYEISNFAREGFESRHNLGYWRMKDYLGFGVSAHSYFDGSRFFVPRDMHAYLRSGGAYYETERAPDLEEDAYEYAMLALRLSEGLSLADYRARFAKSFTDGREEVLDRLRALGYLTVTDTHLSLSEEGMLLSNAILTELL